MSQVHVQIANFNSGELSPLMGARFAVEKVASGCRRLRNFLIHVHGPAFRRPGLEWMGANAGNGAKSRLLRFNFSTSTGFILEFHPAGLQVWSNGLLVPLQNPVPLPYSEAECAEVQMVQVNDVCYLTHPNHAPRKLVRWADDDWRLSEVPWKWPALGDENVRSDEIATPAPTEVLSVPTYEWPEFTIPASYISDFSVTDGDTSSAIKTARLQKFNGTDWVNLHTFTWTTVAPGPFEYGSFGGARCRMTYSGPSPGTAGSKVSVTWTGSDPGSQDLPLDVAQPENLVSVTVAAGEWQVIIDGTGDSIPAGAHPKLDVQKKVGASWVTLKTLTPEAGSVVTWRGAKLATAAEIRLNWRGQAMMGGTASIEQIVFPETSEITLNVSETSGTGRTMTASEAIFVPGHVGSYWQITHRREESFVQIVSAEPTISAANSDPIRVQGKWEVFSYGTWSATLFLEKKVAGDWETLRSWSSRKDRNVVASGEEDSEVELRLRVTAGTSDAATGAAVPRFVLEASDAEVSGVVRVTAIGALDASGKAATATVDVLTEIYSTDDTPLWTEGAWSDAKGYPRTVALHGGRLWFGGTRTEPQRLWGSQVNDFENFRRSSLDDASVSFTPAAVEANQINWMLSQDEELIIGTSGEEWTLGPGTPDGPITPTSVLMRKRSGYGSRFIPALTINEAVVFVQRGGRKVRQIVPRTDVTAWSAADMTVLAEHVTQSGVLQGAAMSNPFTVLWAVTEDGKLLGMTFEQEQNVFGWHVHETDGLIESVAVVNGADVDEVWVAVSRDGKRSIERLDPAGIARAFDAPARLIYVDAGRRFEFAEPVTQVSGLDHLNGREVQVLGDGAQQSNRTVVDGAIVLETAAKTVVVGLPFTSELQPMRIDIPLRDGTAQGRQFKLSRVVLSLHESLGGEIAAAPDGRFEVLNFREAATPMDSPPALFTGDKEAALESRSGGGVDVVVRQRAPLPLNVGAITLKLDVFGE